MSDHIDIMVACRQGAYYRLDAQQFMTDTEYAAWYISQTRGRVKVKKARKEYSCLSCFLPILKGSDYFSIHYGMGLSSFISPDRIHKTRDCLKGYAEKRKAKFCEQGYDPIKKEFIDG